MCSNFLIRLTYHSRMRPNTHSGHIDARNGSSLHCRRVGVWNGIDESAEPNLAFFPGKEVCHGDLGPRVDRLCGRASSRESAGIPWPGSTESLWAFSSNNPGAAL